jgi:serine/threonine-protein kinase
VTDTPSHVGLRIDNKYLIEDKLGSGGMATVYRATRLLIGDTVAIKILHPGQVDDRQSVERFRREAQAAARLKHPNVVPIYDFGVSSDGLVYLVMELVEGKSIRDMLREHGAFAPQMASEIVTQVCSALEEAHKRNVIHRDIKPDNIVVDATPAGIRVKVLDFGIAWMRDVAAASLTETGNIVGTPHYMSPEQCLGEEPDPRTDIYSLGVVLFEILAGVVPFNARASTAVVVQHVNQQPPSLRAINSSVPPAVESVVMHALAKQRDQRPQSAALLAAELRAAIGGHAVRSNRASSNVNTAATTVKMPLPNWSAAQQSAHSHSTASKSKYWMVASAGIVVIAGATWIFLSNGGGPDVTPRNQSDENTTLAGVIDSKAGGSDNGSAPFDGVDSLGTLGKQLPPVAGDSNVELAPQPKDGQVGDTAAKALAASDEPAKTSLPRAARDSITKNQATRNVAPRNTTRINLATKIPTATNRTPVNPSAANRAVVNPPAANPVAANLAAPNPAAANPPAPNPAPTSIVAPKEAVRPGPRPNLAALATQAAGNCVDALRSNNVARMTQLYPEGSPQDRANREKLLARMREAASRLTVTGSPAIGTPQTDENSAYTDFVVRLTWRGNFGQTVNKATTFRATIAPTENDSHISCRIIGNAAL